MSHSSRSRAWEEGFEAALRWSRDTSRRAAVNPYLDETQRAPAAGWLARGLRQVRAECDANPELAKRVAEHPSGFLPEPPPPDESKGS